jgi:hypothetical protein
MTNPFELYRAFDIATGHYHMKVQDATTGMEMNEHMRILVIEAWSLLMFQDIPLLILQGLIFYGVLDCQEIFDDNRDIFWQSFVSSALSVSFFLFGVYRIKQAYHDTFLRVGLMNFLGFTTYFPFDGRFLSKTEEDIVICYSGIRQSVTLLTSMTGFQSVAGFKYGRQSWQSLINHIKLWQSAGLDRHLTVVLGKSVDPITVT